MNWFLEGSETYDDLEGEQVIYSYSYQGHKGELRVAHPDHLVRIDLPRQWRITTYEKITRLISAYEGDIPAPEIDWDNAPAWANFCTIDRNGARHWWDLSPTPARASGKWENEDATTFPVTMLHHWRGMIYQRPDPDAQEDDFQGNLQVGVPFDDFIEAQEQQAEIEIRQQERQLRERQRERALRDALRRRRVRALEQGLAPDMEAEALARAAAEGHPVAVAVERANLPDEPQQMRTLVQQVNAQRDVLRNVHFEDLPHHSVMIYEHDNGEITPVVYWLWTRQGPIETHDPGVIVQILERLQRGAEQDGNTLVLPARMPVL